MPEQEARALLEEADQVGFSQLTATDPVLVDKIGM